MKSDFALKFIRTIEDLEKLSEVLMTVSAFALDIETSDWWNRHKERIALIQIAYRTGGKVKVAVIDALANLDIDILRQPFENASILKVIHNAAFDAAKLKTHYDFNVAPVFDTMSAARRSGEKKYSLKAQADIHLNLRIDKTTQGSDWSRRPLDVRQLHYAALDPYAALLLYEYQIKRGFVGDCRLRQTAEQTQNLLPLEECLPITQKFEDLEPTPKILPSKTELSKETIAVLGIITELASRYSPDGLAASVGAERVGLARWMVDRRLGVNAEPDEETVKLAINELCEKKLIEITDTRRMQPTEKGRAIWQNLKS